MSQKLSHSIFKGKLQGQILGSVLEGGGGQLKKDRDF